MALLAQPMAINLSNFEAGTPFEGDYDGTLKALQERLSRILVAHIVHKRRAAIVFEGWDASGKGGAIKRLTAGWDPRAYCVWSIHAPTEEEKGRHFLWRFWTRLPASGMIAVFDRSWYGRVLVERVEGIAGEAEWQRAYDEINEFEAQQIDAGMSIVKLFLHVTAETEVERLKARLDHPWKRWKIEPDDFRNLEKRDAYLAALRDMFAHTNTRWAPWHVIDGNNKKAARIATLTAIADKLEQSVLMEPPPPSKALEELARKVFGGLETDQPG
jgi:polyphosphate kinase 2 (PPK2 family)